MHDIATYQYCDDRQTDESFRPKLSQKAGMADRRSIEL
jgi:hypothetical protein